MLLHLDALLRQPLQVGYDPGEVIVDLCQRPRNRERRGEQVSLAIVVNRPLATLRDDYVAGLTAYRVAAPAGSTQAGAAVNEWLRTFVKAAAAAVDQSQQLAEGIRALREEWTIRLAAHRRTTGRRAAPRADSAVARLLDQLPEAPVVTTTTLSRILDVSFPAAGAALDELRSAGILTTQSIDRGATAFICSDVLDLATMAERQLASTQFDTRAVAPNRPVPARPQH